jgi:hypothetical protein
VKKLFFLRDQLLLTQFIPRDLLFNQTGGDSLQEHGEGEEPEDPTSLVRCKLGQLWKVRPRAKTVVFSGRMVGVWTFSAEI